MRYLLDTHTFLWWTDDYSKLSPKALAICQDASNQLLLSFASIWELQIKIQIGKLDLTTPLNETVRRHIHNGLELLPIELPHIYGLASLPAHHRDPFDRMMIAQAIHENITLISNDRLITQYPVTVVW